MRDSKVFHYKDAIDRALLLDIKEKADAQYTWIEKQYEEAELPYIFELPKGGVYVKNAHSFTLNAIFDPKAIQSLLEKILSNPIFGNHLGKSVLVNLSQLWLRRQFPLEQYAQGPHHWHQDGALGYDFLNHSALTEQELLDILTIWIPLNDCGITAPGLEFIKEPQTRIFSLDEIKEHTLQASVPSHVFVHPSCSVGDVLLFGGNILHRTHVRPNMPHFRTSMGIRIFSEIPERCKKDQYISIDRK